MNLLPRLILALALCAGAAPAIAAAPPVVIGDLIKETQRSHMAGNEVELVWWIPGDFWHASLADQKVPAVMRNRVAELFDKHTVVAVLRGRIAADGSLDFDDPGSLEKALTLVAPDGSRHAAIPAADVDPELTDLLGRFGPVFSEVMGKMGQNLTLLVFPNPAAGGKRAVDPRGTGALTLQLHDRAYSFRLPLGSLLPPMRDAATNETFPGSYRFNPYTGAPLAPAGNE